MTYFKTRIRTLAALKINGYSPYMEARLRRSGAPVRRISRTADGGRTARTGDLRARFHVALIPEQQTFAHMHESLKWEALAPLAELPHGYLLAESDPATYAYLAPLLRRGTRGRGSRRRSFTSAPTSRSIWAAAARRARRKCSPSHVNRVAAMRDAANGARPMIWDDAVQADPVDSRACSRSAR